MGDTDSRWYTRAYEVHYWPYIGRVLVIHVPGMGDEPIVTDLRIVGTGDANMGDSAFSMALALAESGNPAGILIRHDEDGRMMQQALGSLAETIIRKGTDSNVTTWADGFGVWYVRVSSNAVAPLIAARRALRDELTIRENNVRHDVWMYPERVPDLDTDGTMVYRENTSDPTD